ncbi:MAG: hypothetical protein KAJ92_00810 [Gammaproteobacteria bacterium]|nr:hypothetical protein [Gammaproteobacteria bacterium]MCK5262185.1 hypothetical protein [Gammaproteobacteria bacterium]
MEILNRLSIGNVYFTPKPVRQPLLFITILITLFASSVIHAALTVPTDAQMPGTQIGEASQESVTKCDNCHHASATPGPAVNVVQDWRGSMMAHAGRDPIYWATVAIAEQDFDGAGDICIRCHTMGGWLAGHSTPTDGSALSDAEAAEGVGCDVCHKMTNPDNSEHLGVQNAPFIANDGGSSVEGYYGSGQLSLSGNTPKLGPYSVPDDANPTHQANQSLFHRSVDFCGSCHDVSNPVVGDLAPNHGAQQLLDPSKYSGALGGDVSGKAAFNNPPYKYGVVERTFSEYKASLLSQTLVSDYASLPGDLQNGSIQKTYNAALVAGQGGNYADGTDRYFSCQACHMTPMTGLGANKAGVPVRNDLPMHDLTGGNYWIPEVMQYMDTNSTLLLGGALSADDISGLDAGILRAKTNLENAGALSVLGNNLKVTNLTGHKLISGYPEGRRMWLNIVWKDGGGATIREDGEYGAMAVDFDVNNDTFIDANDTVNTLLDLNDANTKIYEAHGAITQDWAAKLIAVSSAYATVPVAFDRVTGLETYNIGQVAAQDPGTYHETFHFVLNNKVVKDNRIPPYGMDYDEALKRNVIPVPATQYGNPTSGGTFNYWDDFQLNPPTDAVSAEIKLMYQPTSWEYIEFLYLANSGNITFLANEGSNLLDAWLNTGMAAPHVMASTSWFPDNDSDGIADSVDPNDDNDGYLDTEDNCTLIVNDQLDADGDLYGNACDADFNNDDIVNSLDIGLFKAEFFTTGVQETDLNSDSIVNSLDLGLFKKLIGSAPGPSGVAP